MHVTHQQKGFKTHLEQAVSLTKGRGEEGGELRVSEVAAVQRHQWWLCRNLAQSSQILTWHLPNFKC